MAIQAKYTSSKGLVDTVKEGFASGTLDIANDIVLTSTIKGDSRNNKTFELQVADPAANAGEAVLVAFTGTSDAVVCTVTPDDAPLTLTSAELVELINTGLVNGKDVTITEGDNLRRLQTASGGGAQNLVKDGEGDNKTATFLGAPTAEFHIQGIGLSSDLETVKAGEFEITCVAAVGGNLQGLSFSLDTGNNSVKKFVIQAGGADVSGSNTNVNVNGADVGANDVATAVATAINGLADFAAASNAAVVTVKNAKTGLTDQLSLGAGTSGFTFAITSEGAGAQGGVLNATGVSIIGHNHGGAAAMSLDNLTQDQAGTIKLIRQASAGAGNFDVTIKKHADDDDEVKRFAADTRQLSLIWLGDKWSDLISRLGGNKNTATAP